MWEGKEEEPTKPTGKETDIQPEPTAEQGETNDDDDDFGDDFDDFAEGEEADDDFGDFDEADATPMAPEPQPSVQPQQPDILAGLVSSVQSNSCSQRCSYQTQFADMSISATTKPLHDRRTRIVYPAIS